MRGVYGRAFVALRALELIADALDEYTVTIVSPGDGVEIAARLLAVRTGLRVEIETSPQDEDLQRLFSQARCAVILNSSQRLEPAVQMAIMTGTFPITGDSCRESDWIRGFSNGLLVDADNPTAVAAALRYALSDDKLVNTAVGENEALIRRWSIVESFENPIIGLYRQAARTPTSS